MIKKLRKMFAARINVTLKKVFYKDSMIYGYESHYKIGPTNYYQTFFDMDKAKSCIEKELENYNVNFIVNY